MPTRDTPPKVFHPFLFAVFPVLFLYSQNIGEVIVYQTFKPLGVCLAGGFVLWCLLGFFCKSKLKSEVLTSILLVSIFAYGHVFSVFKGAHIGSWKLGIHTYFLPVWTVVFFSLSVAVFRTSKPLLKLTRIMNVVAVCLVAMLVGNIGMLYAKTLLGRQDNNIASVSPDPESIEPGNIISRPDIYYIILDAHLRADILERFFGHDSSAFISRLKDNGFFVGENSRSNYIQTLVSLPSSLNFKYLDEVAEAGFQTQADEKIYLRNMAVNNRLFKFLREQGYSLVSFSSSCPFTNFEDADVYLSGVYSSDNFTNELINSTPFIALEKFSKSRHLVQYRKIKYILNYLPETAKIESPHIVFSHIMCPHPPFVLDEDGNFRSSGETFRWEDENPDIRQRMAKYLAQVKYIDKKIGETIEGILANSKEEPVIIIQGDHGIRWSIGKRVPQRKYAILNALHLPGYDYSNLDDEITPVNTFRFILNHYFGTDLEILENKTYLSGPPENTEFTEADYEREV